MMNDAGSHGFDRRVYKCLIPLVANDFRPPSLIALARSFLQVLPKRSADALFIPHFG